MGVSKLYRPQGSGLRGEKGGLEGGVLGAGVERDGRAPCDAAGGCGRCWVGATRPDLLSETLSCVQHSSEQDPPWNRSEENLYKSYR